MAATQPTQKALTILETNTHRDLIIAEFGAPVVSEQTAEGRKEIYTFVQGYHPYTKMARSVFHGSADVFTVGLWEVFGTPIEGFYNGQKVSVSVLYDADNRVKQRQFLLTEKNPQKAKHLLN